MPKSPSIKAASQEAKWVVDTLPIRLFGDPVLINHCEPITKEEISSGEAEKWAISAVVCLGYESAIQGNV